ncbi:P27 family phage terminase small subunit [Flavobacterium sp. NRK1]|uniref:P27 family phage terminase small subunit n=1 Tax=Flavobacterium sp. NRK1 TaxID=2954929 RepID=UPI002093B91E|nr:P27 family phage terminase small subunit [Flavobacterium sp. NRK1]MCO6149079.1 P27 family phage terminase small subunit [Flavobacterium sp. NRK1]
MDNGNMRTVHIGQGKDTLMEAPAPPAHLNKLEKKAYKNMGNLLAKAERLKPHFLGLLESYSVYYAQWIYACKQITALNDIEMGKGFIQKFSTGARNISPEVTLRDNAFDGMLKCSKQFGLDPKSEKDIKAAEDTGQLDLFQQLLNAKNAK